MWHLARLMILHLVQAFAARQTRALRPPPKPDPASVAGIIIAILSSFDWTDYSFINFLLLPTAYANVWLMQLYYVQAAAM
jgi:hypothetical protein